MKKNVILLSILSIMLVFTFYFQEEKLFFQSSEIDFIPLKLPSSLVIDDSIFKKSDVGYVYRKHLIDKKNVRKWMDLFKDLSLVGDVKNPFGEVVTRIKFDESSLKIFQLNPITGNFCIQVNSKFYLVSSNHQFNGVYKNETEKKARSYEYFIHQLTDFKKIMISPVFSKVVSFTRIIGEVQKIVSFEGLFTKPAPIKHLGIDKSAFASFKDKLERLTPINIQDLSTEELEEMASFEIIDQQGLRKFKFYQFGLETYLKDLQTEAYLEFREADLDFLFYPMKEFWNKKIIDLSVVDHLDLSIKGISDHKFQVDKNLNIFNNDGQRNILLEQSIKEILCYMSHCRENYSYLDVNPIEHFSDNSKKLEILGQVYSLKLKDNILYIGDKKNKLQYKYLWPLLNKENPFLNL